MEFDFDRLKEQGLDLVMAARKTAKDLAAKGKEQAQLLELQAKLSKAQRQLGALVYSLAKSGEENQPLVEKYIATIDEIEQGIEQLKSSIAPSAEPEEAPEEEETVVVEETSAKCCPHCSAEVEGEELFCHNCGAQL